MKPCSLIGLNRKRNSDFKEKKRVMGETMQFHALVHLQRKTEMPMLSQMSVLVECDFTLPASALYS